ncbi:hypothetical protein HCZ03_00540 [Limosilactobacillus fermentum]
MSKLIWRYDVNTKQLVGNGIEVDDNYALKDGETWETPGDGLLPPITFNGKEWEGATFENWLKANPVTLEPTQMQQVVMQQSQQIALLQSTMMSQNQANVKLQATNQQQEKQIEQLQQLLMQANQQQAVADKKGEN